jgi:hypothetical protein
MMAMCRGGLEVLEGDMLLVLGAAETRRERERRMME